MRRTELVEWIERYESLWRTAGTDGLSTLFAADVTYLPSPWAEPICGHEALAHFWAAERYGPDESFTLRAEVIAVDGYTGVARIEVDYTEGRSWRDLWIVLFDADGRCARFEEWPFAPGQPDGHES